MWLTTVSFLMLIFGTIQADLNSGFNELIDLDVEKSVIGDRSNLCLFGVKSVSVVLFTSNNTKGQPVEVDEFCELLDDKSKLVFFITHGFLATAYNYNFSNLASELIENDRIVFSTDWSDAACYNDPTVVKLLEYPFAAENTRKVGEHLASYVKSLIDKCGVPLSNISLMGHSLGTHISSYAAKNLSNTGYGKVPLLIGTDPAAPLFLTKGCTERFCIKDAKRVVAFHTSYLGLQESLGHCDLWFNNGFSQPACGWGPIGTANLNCSHNVAIKYMVTLLLADSEYLAVPIRPRPTLIPDLWTHCPSNTENCNIVDKTVIFDSDSTLTGDYCVSVSAEYPYSTKNDFNCQT